MIASFGLVVEVLSVESGRTDTQVFWNHLKSFDGPRFGGEFYIISNGRGHGNQLTIELDRVAKSKQIKF